MANFKWDKEKKKLIPIDYQPTEKKEPKLKRESPKIVNKEKPRPTNG